MIYYLRGENNLYKELADGNSEKGIAKTIEWVYNYSIRKVRKMEIEIKTTYTLTETEMKRIIARWLCKLDFIDMWNIASGFDSFKNWADGKLYENCTNYAELVRIADGIVGEIVGRKIDGNYPTNHKQPEPEIKQTEILNIPCNRLVAMI